MPHDAAVRYARTISLPEVGEAGQDRLQSARVLVIGAGGLGSSALMYLAAAGIGTLGIVDDDRVALSNLQRQILFETGDIGRPKAESAADALRDLNPEVRIEPHALRLTEANAARLIASCDLVVDGSDNFATRLTVNRHCLAARKTLVSAAVIGFTGQLYTFKPYLGAPHPCYQCLVPELPPPEATPTCAESGVLGSVAGMLGAWQATEVIKELLGIGESLSGHMLVVDALQASVRKVALPRDPACMICGESA